MADVVTFRIRSTEAQMRAFARVLSDDAGVELHEVTRAEYEADRSEAPLGHSEVADLLVSFGTSVAGTATVEIVMAAFRRFNRTRPHMTLEQVTTDDPGEQ